MARLWNLSHVHNSNEAAQSFVQEDFVAFFLSYCPLDAMEIMVIRHKKWTLNFLCAEGAVSTFQLIRCTSVGFNTSENMLNFMVLVQSKGINTSTAGGIQPFTSMVYELLVATYE